jgi:hypothetical protein
MYPTLFTIVTAALIAALYAELRGLFDAMEKNKRDLQPITIPKRRSGRRPSQ